MPRSIQIDVGGSRGPLKSRKERGNDLFPCSSLEVNLLVQGRQKFLNGLFYYISSVLHKPGFKPGL